MADDSAVGDTRIRVILRCRPPNKQEEGWFKSGEFKHILRSTDQTPNPDKVLIIDSSGKENRFDKIFRGDCKQVAVFREAAMPTLENVFKGFCGAIMAYGQTGTGKTHTMQGYDKTSDGDERGIIPRSADYLFTRAAKETMYDFTITCSMVQIYLDKLQDLFMPEAPELNINPDSERVEMPGLSEKTITNLPDFMKLFYFGEAHRITRPTLMNPTSSRGHSALIVNVRMAPRDAALSTKVGKLVLVDLAGYERFALTGITTGIAAEEAKKINASLLALGGVVNSLADKQKHVPYRNSKLTRLLRDCLGGSSKSTIVLAIGPSDKYKQETAGTLYFGFRAMAVKVDARIKEEYDPAKYIINLKEKLSECGRTMQKLVKFMKEKGVYEEYTTAYGVPDIPDFEADDDDDEQEIVRALTRQPSKYDMDGPSPAARLSHEDMLGGAEMDADPSVPANVRQVRREWDEEVMQHTKATEKELEMMRLKHLQELEEAKKAGASEEVLLKLRNEHNDELSLMREQNQLLRGEIVRQKAKAEAQALLSSAVQAKVEPGGSAVAVNQDNARVGEMVAHLQETCENKDEVLVRLFELVCLREAELHDLEQNMTAIASAMAPAGGGGSAAEKSENSRLKNELARKEQEIEQLKNMVGGGGGGASPPQRGSPLLRPGASAVQPLVRPNLGGAGPAAPGPRYAAGAPAPMTRAPGTTSPLLRPANSPLRPPASPSGAASASRQPQGAPLTRPAYAAAPAPGGYGERRY